ncbi:hypothetical protein [Pseudolysinimonas sp.]
MTDPGTPADDAAETVTATRFTATPPDDEEAAETIVVDRELDGETVVVERDGDSTVVVEREAADGTVAVTRARPASPSTPALGRGRRRRGMTMPPVAPGYGRGAVVASGPGAVSTYEPRAMPEPLPAPTVFPGVAATRVPEALPSVQRRSRRAAVVTLALVAASGVVSVVGLVALGFAVFG